MKHNLYQTARLKDNHLIPLIVLMLIPYIIIISLYFIAGIFYWLGTSVSETITLVYVDE